ncbi:MAG: flagellar protein FlaG [Desulfobacterota bacterium]|nr:flagellar protein FlaG [Thermodesulfobacteriota bacterium]
METETIRSIGSVQGIKETRRTIGKELQPQTSVENPLQNGSILPYSSPINQGSAEEIASQINEFLASVQKDLKVEIHRETKTPIFKIVRRQDNKVLQEIPPHELLVIRKTLEKFVGTMLNLKA